MSDNPKWRELPILRELHSQWLASRGDKLADSFQRPFGRDWETLLADANLISAESRNEANRDARMLANASLLTIKTVKHRPEFIQRVAIPLEAANRLRELFPECYPEPNDKFDPTAIAWEPEMGFMREARVSVNSGDLLKLNSFFKNRSAKRLIAPIKERSIQIFDDEKRLDYLLGSALFREGRLSLEMLACEIVGQPFGWKRGPIDTGKILVVENAATWHSYSRWNSERRLFSAVVYGCGNCFLENVRHLADILAEFPSPQRVFYFGDLDYQGLRIPTEASKRATKIGLPQIEPDLWSYTHLLKFGKQQEVEYDPPETSFVLEYQWLAELAEPVRAILESGNRLAQEHIGLEFLSAFHDEPIYR
jgi:hypothetical protein